MPVAFLRALPKGGFVPVARERFRLGRHVDCDLVDPSPGVAAHHATLRYLKGEHVLSATEGHSIEVAGKGTPFEAVPLMALRDGDEVRLASGATPWVFRSRVDGSFRPPGASVAAAWMAHPDFGNASYGPERFGPGAGVGGRDRARCRQVAVEDGALVVKLIGSVRSPAHAQDHLRLLAAIGGAPCPALARLVDGGLAQADGAVERWLATRWVDGTSARTSIQAGELSAPRVLRILLDLAAGLKHLHRRGITHRDVSPGNVIISEAEGAVLIDYGQAVGPDAEVRASAAVVGTPGFVAPEEILQGRAAVSPAVDVYGLAAVGYALLTGRAPAQGDDLLSTLSEALREPPRPRDLGVEVPEALEAVLLEGLAPEPAARPDAAAFASALEFVGVQVGLGSV